MLSLRTLLGRASRTYVTIGRQVSNLSQTNGVASTATISKVAPATVLASPLVRQFSTAPSLENVDEDSVLDYALVAPAVKRSASDVLAEYETLKMEGTLSATKYHNLMAELASQHNFGECMRMLNSMKEAGLADAKAYSYAIAAGRPSLLFHEVRFLFGEPLEGRSDDGPSADSRQSSDMFGTICKLMEEMKAKNMELDMLLYEDMGRALAAGRQAGLLINVCTAMEKRGITPSIVFYNLLLSALPKKGYMQRAATLYERLIARDMANFSTHIIRIDQLMANGRLDDGLALHKQVHEKITPTRVSFNVLINGFLKNNRLHDALKVFADFKNTGRPECQPDRQTMRNFLTHYYNSSELEGATNVMADMKAAGFPNSATDYGLLIRLNARYDPSQALNLLNEAISKNLPRERLVNDIARVIVDKRVLNEWKVAIHDAFLQSLQSSGEELEMDGPLCKLILERTPSTLGPQEFRHMVKELAAVIDAHNWTANSTLLEYALRRMIIQNDTSLLKDFVAYLSTKKIPTSWNMKNLLLQCHLISGETKGATDALNVIVRSRSPLTNNSVKMLEEHGVPIPEGVRIMGSKPENTNNTKMFKRPNPNRQYNANAE